jgi:hypothetical protein
MGRVGLARGLLATIVGKRSETVAVPNPINQMKTLSSSLGVGAVLLAPLVTLFIGSLAVENQRMFLSCRANGGSTDSCLLLIGGR